ncbi:MAG: Smr/MutS family protein [Spirochaetales bacterium]|nr:Smr/MutS family protein [Spirochaetales bacterium]
MKKRTDRDARDDGRGRIQSSPGGGKSKRRMDEWLDLYPPSRTVWEKEGAVFDDVRRKAETRKELLAMEPQATLDLHGLTAEEAVWKINRFIEESVDTGFRKVIIVHGKGNHSPGGGVLSKVAADCVSRHPLAGENGLSRGKEGGRGARWVILRQRSR